MNVLIRLLFWFSLVIAQTYYAYRYALQYSSETTSPTYSETPFAFQLGKYVLFAGLAGAIGLFSWLTRKLRFPDAESARFYYACVIYFLYIIVESVLSLTIGGFKVGDLAGVEGMFFLPLVLCLPFLYPGFNVLAMLIRCLIGWGLMYHLLYSLLQLGLYLSIQRLPALAYAGGLVRFGGGWDDPNGFGIYLCLVLLLTISNVARYSKLWLLTLLGIIGCLLLATISFSAWICCFVGVFAFAVLRRNIVLSLLLTVTAGGLTGAVLSSDRAIDWIQRKVEQKEGSMNSRLENQTFDLWQKHAGVSEYIIGDLHHPTMSENYYVRTLMSFGGIGAGLFLALLLWTFVKAWRKIELAKRSRRRRAEAFFAAGGAFLMAILVASNFISYPNVFPINYFLWLICFLIWLVPVDARAFDEDVVY